MHDILLADSNAASLEKIFGKSKRILPCWGLQIASEKNTKRRFYPLSRLENKSTTTTTTTKLSYRWFTSDQLKTLNDFQKLIVDINWLQPITGLTTQELCNLFQSLQGDVDLDSPRQLTKEAKSQLRKETSGFMCGSHRNQIGDCILVILPSSHSSTGLIMQRKDSILE